MFFSGSSGRQIGHALWFNKANVYNRIKNKINNQQSVENSSRVSDIFSEIDVFPKANELDELYCFIGKKPKTETK